MEWGSEEKAHHAGPDITELLNKSCLPPELFLPFYCLRKFIKRGNTYTHIIILNVSAPLLLDCLLLPVKMFLTAIAKSYPFDFFDDIHSSPPSILLSSLTDLLSTWVHVMFPPVTAPLHILSLYLECSFFSRLKNKIKKKIQLNKS